MPRNARQTRDHIVCPLPRHNVVTRFRSLYLLPDSEVKERESALPAAGFQKAMETRPFRGQRPVREGVSSDRWKIAAGTVFSRFGNDRFAASP